MGSGDAEVKRRVSAIPIGAGVCHLNAMVAAGDPLFRLLPDSDVPEWHRAFVTLDRA